MLQKHFIEHQLDNELFFLVRRSSDKISGIESGNPLSEILDPH